MFICLSSPQFRLISLFLDQNMLLNHKEVFRVRCTDDWQRPFVVFEILSTSHYCEILCITLSMSNNYAANVLFVGRYLLILTIFATVGRSAMSTTIIRCRRPRSVVSVSVNMAFVFILSRFLRLCIHVKSPKTAKIVLLRMILEKYC